MENKKSSNGMWIVVGVVVLALIIIVVMKSQKPTEVAIIEAPSQNTLQATEDLSAGSVNTPVAPTTTGVAPVTISYANALIKYKNARIQLNDQCQALPRQMTFKNNTNIMIDNRSSASRTLKIGAPVSIKGFGFKIINLSSAKLPATWLVDCDKSQNVATILIQK